MSGSFAQRVCGGNAPLDDCIAAATARPKAGTNTCGKPSCGSGPAHELRQISERRVAAKELVAAAANQRNLESSLANRVRHVVGIEPIKRGLIQTIQRRLELADKMRFAQDQILMLRAYGFGDLPCYLSFAEFSFVETQSKGAYAIPCAFCARFATAEESTPPDKKTPSGTSLAKCRRTDSSNTCANSSSSIGVALVGRAREPNISRDPFPPRARRRYGIRPA